MSDDLVNITIDGHQLSVPKGTLLVEAARQVGIEIPVYCYHPKMKPVGACRVCVVEVEKQRRPIMTACTTTVMPDMVVHTKSDNAIAAREGILEFLLINHPLDCPVCDRGGECDLQDFVLRYGPPTTRFIEQKRHFAKSKQVGKNVVLDRERCIMCQRCVRFCDEIAMEEGLVIIERGNRSEIGTFEGRSYDSKFSGNVIELCPVGALTAKTYRFEARPWEQQHYAGIGNSCSIGPNITVDVRFDKVVRLRSRINDDIDDGWLTDETRYSHLAIHSEDRITHPQIRNSEGELERATWEEALVRVAEELGAEGVTPNILVGSKLSLEDGHMLFRLGRSVLETPNVVHEFAEERYEGEEVFTGRVNGCDGADVILCVGSDPAKTHPQFELRVKKGLRAKAKLVSLGDEPALNGFSDHHGEGVPSELWEKLKEALDSFEAPEEGSIKLPKPRPWEAGGKVSTDWDELVEVVAKAKKVLVVVTGNLAAQGLQDLPAQVEELGWSEAPHGLIHLRSGVNSVGHDLVGLVPQVDQEFSESCKKAWGTFNSTAGASFTELAKKSSQVTLAVGCDPMAVEDCKKPKFLIACATHPNGTTEKADIVLPLSTWVESNGVFVSTDGTVQFNRQAIVSVGQSRPAWDVARVIMEELEKEPLVLTTPRQIYAELGRLNGNYSGNSYADFRTPGQAHWSYPQQAPLGMPRPDLCAIPVQDPDAPMWKRTIPSGSRVENSARLLKGDKPPAVPGQRDPREIAALLGLTKPVPPTEQHLLAEPTPEKREGYVPLRVVGASSAQPPGPTPASRHHEIGVQPHQQVKVPVSQTALLEPEDEPALLEEPEAPEGSEKEGDEDSKE